ncbi:lactococcin 972 family bacteriocin [Clavibacter michiganensis]|uniref:lactococcin 972 family bacteriocin n=1 Tax=Clavibacter michiganensis TaxID=28447 RepID=UPI00195C6F73
MKRTLSIASGVGLVAALLLGGAGAANATTEYVGGGTWNYGVERVVGNYSYSNYLHSSKAHGSTACSSSKCVRSDTVPGGKWSRASVQASAGGNTAYWRV